MYILAAVAAAEHDLTLLATASPETVRVASFASAAAAILPGRWRGSATPVPRSATWIGIRRSRTTGIELLGRGDVEAAVITEVPGERRRVPGRAYRPGVRRRVLRRPAARTPAGRTRGSAAERARGRGLGGQHRNRHLPGYPCLSQCLSQCGFHPFGDVPFGGLLDGAGSCRREPRGVAGAVAGGGRTLGPTSRCAGSPARVRSVASRWRRHPHPVAAARLLRLESLVRGVGAQLAQRSRIQRSCTPFQRRLTPVPATGEGSTFPHVDQPRAPPLFSDLAPTRRCGPLVPSPRRSPPAPSSVNSTVLWPEQELRQVAAVGAARRSSFLPAHGGPDLPQSTAVEVLRILSQADSAVGQLLLSHFVLGCGDPGPRGSRPGTAHLRRRARRRATGQRHRRTGHPHQRGPADHGVPPRRATAGCSTARSTTRRARWARRGSRWPRGFRTPNPHTAPRFSSGPPIRG